MTGYLPIWKVGQLDAVLWQFVVICFFVAALVAAHEKGASGDGDERREDRLRARDVDTAKAEASQPRGHNGRREEFGAGLRRLFALAGAEVGGDEQVPGVAQAPGGGELARHAQSGRERRAGQRGKLRQRQPVGVAGLRALSQCAGQRQRLRLAP